MEIPTMLLYRVLLDVGLQVSDTIERDYKEICSRYEREGMGFLTITLPRLDDILLKGLADGRLTRSDFEGFRAFKRGGSLPALLQGFFRRIFHDDGGIRAVPCTHSIFAIRQVVRLFKKVELPCSERRIKDAYEKYKSLDADVDWRVHRRPLDVSLWTHVCGHLWSDLEELSGELYCFPGIFGSGATSERYRRNQRHSITEWYERSEGSFPASFHAVSRDDSPDLGLISYLEPDSEHPVRVVQVPKTLKTPRTIAVEPSFVMLMQQSVAKPLMTWLERKFKYRCIRFTDQTVNQQLALEGSTSGLLATIDLSDASDRVDNELVKNIFGSVAPTFLKLIQDCRSRRALLPDQSIIDLKKFSSMGSALCFPIEAMVFFSIVVYSLCRQSGKRPSRTFLGDILEKVSVYGDDIIVPTKMASGVMEDLEDFGLKVNRSKSFSTGLFRESCGGDYYAGVNVTPTYVRQWTTARLKSNASCAASYVSLSNQFYMKGMWHACQFVRDKVERDLGPIPRSTTPLGCLSFQSVFYNTGLLWNNRLHGWRVRGPKIVQRVQPDKIGTISGNMLAHFGRRHHADKRYEFATSRRSDVVVDPYVREGFSVYNFPPPGREGRVVNDSPLEWMEDTRDETFLYNRRFVPFSVYLRPGNPHYEKWCKSLIIGGCTLDESDRPYALSLKRKWTTSPVGIPSWTM